MSTNDRIAEPPAGHEGPGWLARLAAGRRVATAESCTAGRIATRLAGEVGASEFLLGGLVAYHEQTKRQLLGVTSPCIYTEEAAGQMAEGVCTLTGADAGVATTGVAGPEPLEGVAPGTVCIGVHVGGETTTRRYGFDGTAEEICEHAATQALVDLVHALRTAWDRSDRPDPVPMTS